MASVFPKFWTALETELNENAEDLCQVKSVLTILGYMTKTSIATLNTPKKIDTLQNDYIKMKSISSESMSERFPALNAIDSFTPGMKLIIKDVATHLLRVSRIQSGHNLQDSGDSKEATKGKILAQAKKLCGRITDSNILIEDGESGMTCKISCPECENETSLSSSENSSTGKISFTIFNFRRHYMANHEVDIEGSHGGECSKTKPNDQQDSPSKEIERLQKKINEIEAEKNNIVAKNSELPDGQFVQNLQADLKEKATQIDELQEKLTGIEAEKCSLNAQISTLQSQIKQKDLNKRDGNMSSLENELQQKIVDLREDISSAETMSRALTSERDELKEMLDKNVQKIETLQADLKDKVNQIAKLQNEVKAFRAKSVSNAFFDIQLCCFENLTSNTDVQTINFEDSRVEFKDCQNKNVWLYFNQIHEGGSNERKFENVKPYINEFIAGNTACVFSHGTTGSGKSCTMFGANNCGDGIVPRSVEMVLNEKNITVSVVELIQNDFFDLGNGSKVKVNGLNDAVRKEIVSAIEFKQLLMKTLKLRSQESTDQNLTSSRSHLIINLRSVDSGSGSLTFIDLAGWESPDNKPNPEQTKFINSSLTSLNTVLEKLVKKEQPSYDSKLAKLFKPLATSPVCVLYHVSKKDMKKGLENIKNIVASNKTSLKRKALTDLTNAIPKRNK